MDTSEVDFLIVGQGLAGSLLAWHLMERGRRVLVIDDNHATSSSRVAAGLVNPLAGMRFNAHPRTAEWLAGMHRTYDEIARTLRTAPYFHSVPMRRLFRSPEQQRFYRRQRENPAAQPYLAEPFGPDEAGSLLRAPHGGFWQRETGYVTLPRLLGDLRAWLRHRGALRIEPLPFDRLAIDTDGIRMGMVRARHLVFCEGYRVRSNPWFDWLPLQPDKGEILRLETSQPLGREIVNGAHWLVPLAEGGYRFGATHGHRQIDCRPTPEGRSRLEQGLGQLLSDVQGIEITEHQAGVRPATPDRSALLGSHPQMPRLHVFNGFGARGALSIPWHAGRMSDYLDQGTALPSEVDVARWSNRR
ncbi:MAG: FAD-binding oxidoreductase [Gammaproteobacteria bacterium]|nr:MAG: FAD-binding oxidoreductase [Gammaproteobacteria bacterium]